MTQLEKVAGGMAIFARYGVREVCAEHDVIYCGDGSLALSQEDAEELARLGWFVESETESWARYV